MKKRVLCQRQLIEIPTGSRNEESDDGGELAEVTIEPGTGSTNSVVGLIYQEGIIRETNLSSPLGNFTWPR